MPLWLCYLMGGSCQALPILAAARPWMGFKTALKPMCSILPLIYMARTLSVELTHFIRPEQKFDGLEALKAQIAVDCETARSMLDR